MNVSLVQCVCVWLVVSQQANGAAAGPECCDVTLDQNQDQVYTCKESVSVQHAQHVFKVTCRMLPESKVKVCVSMRSGVLVLVSTPQSSGGVQVLRRRKYAANQLPHLSALIFGRGRR